MNEQDQELLWRYFDGEMPSEEASTFAQRLADDADLSAEHAMLEQTRDLLRVDVEHAVDAADFSNFFDAVQARIGDEPAPAPISEPAPVPAERPAETPGLGARIAEWWRAHWTPVVVSAVAAGVVAFLVIRAGVPGAADTDTLTTGPVTVDEVRNSGNQTVLISQPAEDGSATVIWLLEDEEEPEDSSAKGEDPI